MDEFKFGDKVVVVISGQYWNPGTIGSFVKYFADGSFQLKRKNPETGQDDIKCFSKNSCRKATKLDKALK